MRTKNAVSNAEAECSERLPNITSINLLSVQF